MKVKLTIDADIDLQGTDPEVIRKYLRDFARDAIGEGFFTGGERAETVSWSCDLWMDGEAEPPQFGGTSHG